MKSNIIVLLSFFLFQSVSLQAQVQYKRLHRNEIARIVDGNAQQTIQYMHELLEQDSRDPETYFVLALAWAAENDYKKAMENVKESLKWGLPYERYFAGPRTLTEPLINSRAFQKFASEKYPQFLHGPMLGDVTSNAAAFWVRTYQEVPIEVVVEARNDESFVKSGKGKTNAADDFTAIVRVEGLPANTEFDYYLVVDTDTLTGEWRFHTSPEDGEGTVLKIGFGGGAGFTPKYHYMWNTVASHWFNAFLFLGDNVYIDYPTYPKVQDFVYYRRQSEPNYRKFIANTPVYAIWDDHDFGTNDSWGTTAVDSPAWKVDVLSTYKNNWVNPYYAGGDEQPGVWTSFSMGDVDVFMLDCRYYRTTPEDEHADMLSHEQREWLYNELKQSSATFKIIASSVPWAYGTKPGMMDTPAGMRTAGLDTWEGFQEERDSIFNFLHENQIEGVVLLSADRHRSDAWKINRDEGYALYEFMSSKLTNIHTHPVIPASLFGYNEKCSFGLLEINTTLPDPQVTYQIRSIDNELINEFTVRKSQLSY